MARKPQVINLEDVYQKWVRLLTHVQNGVAPVYRCSFQTEAEAKHAYTQMHNACVRDSWFRLRVFRKHGDVYIVKSDAIQDIVIKGL